MKIIQSLSFEKKVKKFSPRQKKQLDNVIREILKEPSIGQQKKGDLKMIFVHKFYMDKKLYLIAYSSSSDLLELIMIGPHENYYSDLKNYLRKR